MLSTSRSVHNNGMSSGMSRFRGFPFTLSVIIVRPIYSQETYKIDHTTTAEVNLCDEGTGEYLGMIDTASAGSPRHCPHREAGDRHAH
jgi:hypothetical protein